MHGMYLFQELLQFVVQVLSDFLFYVQNVEWLQKQKFILTTNLQQMHRVRYNLLTVFPFLIQ